MSKLQTIPRIRRGGNRMKKIKEVAGLLTGLLLIIISIQLGAISYLYTYSTISAGVLSLIIMTVLMNLILIFVINAFKIMQTEQNKILRRLQNEITKHEKTTRRNN